MNCDVIVKSDGVPVDERDIATIPVKRISVFDGSATGAAIRLQLSGMVRLHIFYDCTSPHVYKSFFLYKPIALSTFIKHE